jgi:hypothetical protein
MDIVSGKCKYVSHRIQNEIIQLEKHNFETIEMQKKKSNHNPTNGN